MLLALDTSTESLTLAWVDGDRVVGLQEAGGAQASKRLLPAAAELLERNGCGWADLKGLAVTVGPGAFTGLRTACSAAQGLALGLGLRVVPLCSLLVVAEAARAARAAALSDRWTVRVAMDARMGQVYDAVFEGQAQSWGVAWTTRQAPQVRDPQVVRAEWEAQARDEMGRDRRSEIWAGSGLALMGVAMSPDQAPIELSHPGPQAGGLADRVLSDAELDRAGALGRLASWGWRAGAGAAPGTGVDATVDAAALVPVYVRDRVALTTAERQTQAA